MTCKCQTVKQYEHGIWQCMICRRRFIPEDSIEIRMEDLPYWKPTIYTEDDDVGGGSARQDQQ